MVEVVEPKATVEPPTVAEPAPQAPAAPAAPTSIRVTTTQEVAVNVTVGVAIPPAQQIPEIKTRKAAIFVKNRAKEIGDDKTMAFEDMVVARVTELGFSVISREDAINAVSEFSTQGANKGDPSKVEATLDQILSDNTSALRLAQNLGADYVLIASITTFGQQTNQFKDDSRGLNTTVIDSNLRVTYKVLEGIGGGSVVSGLVLSTNKMRGTPNLSVLNTDLINSLLDGASFKLAGQLGAQVDRGDIQAVNVAQAKRVRFNVLPTMTDMSIPQVLKDAKTGEYTVEAGTYKVQPTSMTVEVDGVVVGTTSSSGDFDQRFPFESLPGLHKIRVSREGFKDWEKTIFLRDEMQLTVALQFTDEGRQRWMENARFLNDLVIERKLTDGQVKMFDQIASMLEKDGLRVIEAFGNDRRPHEPVNQNNVIIFPPPTIINNNVAAPAPAPARKP